MSGELNPAELSGPARDDLRQWALDELTADMPKPNVQTSIRGFLFANISATALVAGKWADWKDMVEK